MSAATSTTAPPSPSAPPPAHGGLSLDPLERLCRRLLLRQLARLRDGALRIVEGGRVTELGGERSADVLSGTITIRDPRVYGAAVRRGLVGIAEAYMDGHWTADDLTDVIRVVARNSEALAGLSGRLGRIGRLGLRGVHALRRNSRRGSQRNIAAHYDLGNDFFSLFLDPTLTYSCGVFERDDSTLEEASREKYDRACKKLQLGADDHVLEVGSGWGGFALHAAGRYGCRVTSVTVSKEQLELARRRVADAGLQDRVEIRFQDYRDVRGTFDKLVSIEMIEAVGQRYLPAYFQACSDRLSPEGLMLLQVITIPDQGYEQSVRSVEFIKRYIFPGGQCPSLWAIEQAIKEHTDLRMIHLEDMSAHYARTLAGWRERLTKNLDDVRSLGLPETFLRMWEFYLCYCEGGFAERATGVAQILFEKPRGRREPVLGRL